MKTCGIDIGARTIEAVIYDTELGEVIGYRISDTGSTPTEAVLSLLESLLKALHLKPEDLSDTVVTGYGRKSFPLPKTTVTEITCHAQGVARLLPEAGTVIDIGGQDSKVIVLEEGGRVRDFSMNDRCAAGTGRFLEMTADLLEVPIGEMGNLALKARRGVEISSMCAVFAESEIVGLIATGHPKNEILLGVIESVAKRIASQIGRTGLQEKVVLTGGVAKNAGIIRALEKELHTMLIIPDEPQITGALGAALIAACRMNP